MSTVSGSTFSFQQISVGGVWEWSVQALNNSGLPQPFQIVNIITPYGRFADADIPIPGDVITAMAQSVLSMQGQLAPLLALVNGINTFNILVTEGDPLLYVASVSVQNAGAFGSSMNATASPAQPWLGTSPSFLNSLGKGDQGIFNISVNPATLLASGSPFSGTVNLQDNRIPSTVIPITIVVTVLPRPAIQVLDGPITFTYSLSTGTVGMGAGTVRILNAGPPNSVLNFTLGKTQNCSPWLQLSTLSGGPIAAGGQVSVSATLLPAQVPMLAGTLTETIQVMSTNASNSPQTFDVNLIINP